MSKLRVVHTFGKHAGTALEFTKDSVRFGRAPESDVRFDADYDRDASTHHAEARCSAGVWTLMDLKSRNGLFVNGERVTTRGLRSGDEITFGGKGPRVRVELEAVMEAVEPMKAGGTALASPIPGALVAAGMGTEQSVHVPVPEHVPVREHVHVNEHVHVSVNEGAAQMAAPQRPAKTAPDAEAPPAPAPAVAFRPAPAPVAAPAAGARVGQRTMAYMISSAVAVATGRSKPMKTIEISAMVDERVGAATAGHRRQAIGLGVMLLLAFAALGGVILWGRQSSDNIASLREKLAGLPPEDPRRKDIENKLGTLHPANASFGRDLYDRSKKGVFMLAANGEGFCTAFAVRPNVLATNAHCIVAAQQRGGRITALENEGHGQVSYTVSDMKPHPQYRDKDETHITPDVGVVTISGRAATVLELASAAELQQTGTGDEVYLIGFPGRLMDAQNPAATFMGAHIGRLTNAVGRPGAFADAWLVQHDAQTTHGTSGSPVFNGKGHVIAVNAGGYLEGDDETISGKKTEVVKDSPYKFGMRVDLLDAVLK